MTVFVAVQAGDTAKALDQLVSAYPTKEQMGLLKIELFGSSTSVARLGRWPASERERLSLALGASGALPLDLLHVRERLTLLAHNDLAAVRSLLDELDWDALDESARSCIVLALADGLETGSLALLATSWSGLTMPLLSLRPDAWYRTEVWSDATAAHIVRSLLAGATEEVRAATFRALAVAGQTGAAVELCEQHPELWWSLFDSNTATLLVSSPEAADVARATLAHVGAEAVGTPPFVLTSLDQFRALVGAADPDDGLWKGIADAAEWFAVLERVRRERWNTSDQTIFNACVVALASAEASGDLGRRETAWKSVFEYMHRYMTRREAPKDSQRTLDRALPGGPKWDWCGRLREGLARVAVDGNWDPDRIHEVASGAGDFAGDIAVRVRRRTDSKREGFLEGLKNLFHL